MNKPLSLPNLIHLKNDYPGAYEDLVKLQEHVNNVTKALGGVAAPVAAGGIIVTGSNGIIDVVIIDKHPEVGEEYFLEWDTQPSFASARGVPLGAVRNYRTGNLNGMTTYWRWYKSTKLGGVSDRVVFGNPPTGVTPGQLSTTNPGPTPGASQGSGQSRIPGYGYGRSDEPISQRRLVVL